MSIRKILYPFSLLYAAIMKLRNALYDKNILGSKEYPLPVIAVGNLSMGGTGKSPMVEYLLRLLQTHYSIATLSRGYKRSSSGFLLVTPQETAATAGDEPLQFKMKFPEVTVAVDADRQNAISQLLQLENPPQVIILDDAFQHRKVKAGLYILLTTYNQLFTGDLVLPAGNLREPVSGAARANIIVVTKCPPDLDENSQSEILRKINPHPKQQVFFSSISYSEQIIGRNTRVPLKTLKNTKFTLVTGIANPQPLVTYLERLGLQFDHQNFPDHHNFTEEELRKLQHEEIIVTTEKDYMRLKNEISREKIFYLPISMEFLKDAALFNAAIFEYLAQKNETV